MQDTESEVHTYSVRAIGGDFLRAAAGLLLLGVPLVVLDLNRWVAGGLGAVAALFGYFAVLTLYRARTTIVTDHQAITVITPRRRRIEWARLDGVTLNFYSTDPKGQGWMQLRMTSGRSQIKVDSRIAGFTRIAQLGLAAARTNGVIPAEATLANFRALGIGRVAAIGEGQPEVPSGPTSPNRKGARR